LHHSEWSSSQEAAKAYRKDRFIRSIEPAHSGVYAGRSWRSKPNWEQRALNELPLKPVTQSQEIRLGGPNNKTKSFKTIHEVTEVSSLTAFANGKLVTFSIKQQIYRFLFTNTGNGPRKSQPHSEKIPDIEGFP
jgi:hypothetical protein